MLHIFPVFLNLSPSFCFGRSQSETCHEPQQLLFNQLQVAGNRNRQDGNSPPLNRALRLAHCPTTRYSAHLSTRNRQRSKTEKERRVQPVVEASITSFTTVTSFTHIFSDIRDWDPSVRPLPTRTKRGPILEGNRRTHLAAMAGEDGGGPAAPGGGAGGAHASGNDHVPAPIITSGESMNIRKQESHQSVNNNGQDDYIISPRVHTPNPFSRKNTSMDIDDYFVSPGQLNCPTSYAAHSNTHLHTRERHDVFPSSKPVIANHRCLSP